MKFETFSHMEIIVYLRVHSQSNSPESSVKRDLVVSKETYLRVHSQSNSPESIAQPEIRSVHLNKKKNEIRSVHLNNTPGILAFEQG
jgi:hypothetical protein